MFNHPSTSEFLSSDPNSNPQIKEIQLGWMNGSSEIIQEPTIGAQAIYKVEDGRTGVLLSTV